MGEKNGKEMAKLKEGWVESPSFLVDASKLWLLYVVKDTNAKVRVNSNPHDRRLTTGRKSQCVGSVRVSGSGELVATYYVGRVATHVELSTNDVDDAKTAIEVLVRMQ